MKKKIMIYVVLIIVAVSLLTACSSHLPIWSIASQNDSCTKATVIDRDWYEGDRSDFYILLKTETGEIGYARVNAYIYDALPIGSATCVK